jgi:uncharacterized protein (UPF0276 family)
MTSSPPYLGVGVGLRRAFYDELLASDRQVDWLEVVSENVMARGGRVRWFLDQHRERRPLIPHGVNLNIGGPDPLDLSYLAGLRTLVELLDAPFFSDHLCYSRLEGVYLHELLPVPFREDVADHVVARIAEAQDRVGAPFLLENPSYYAVMPGQTIPETELLTRIAEGADCGLLLDVNNVYVNAQNHGFDPRDYLLALPLERVGYIHLAGHTEEEPAIIDTHAAPVADPVWDLYRWTLEQIGRPVSTLIEWDADIPAVDVVLDEADKARAVLEELYP